VALTLMAFGRYPGTWTGLVITFMILPVAAGVGAIALALILILFKRKNSLDISLWQEIREPGMPPVEDRVEDIEPAEIIPGPESYPRLTPAGVEPTHPEIDYTTRRD
jgi:NADH-quinone oxidoreductase subunit K